MQAKLHGPHRRTLDAIFKHPIARNLTWREVRSMLDSMDDVVQEQSGQTLKLSRNGRTVTLHPPLQKDFSDVQELMDLRRFLETSLPVPQPRATAAAGSAGAGLHVLVVI